MIKGRTSKTSALLLRMGLLSSFCRAEYQQRDEEEESEQDDADGLPEPSAGRSAADERIERAEHESQPEGLKRHLRNPGLYVAVQRRGERQFEGKQVFCVLGPCLRFLFGACLLYTSDAADD